MTIAIAGRAVQEGDPLYHRGLQAWGTVVGFDVGIAVLRVIQGETHTKCMYGSPDLADKYPDFKLQ